ncbi:MAG: pentapeptide repeat-containing protein [Cyanobacteria bacterium J06635_15]
MVLTVAIATLTLTIFPTAAQAQDNRVDYTLTDQSGKDFSGLNLSGTSFAAAEARDANFEGSDLSGTILTKASFLRANLKGADLTQVFADRVIFDGADMTDVIFVDAIATSTSFNNTNITGADFSDSILDRFQVSEMCKRAEGINPVTGIPTRESLGCRD